MRAPEMDPEAHDIRESYAPKERGHYDMDVAGIVVYLVMMSLFFIVAVVMMLFRNELAIQVRPHPARPVIVAAAELTPM
jgi:hypothetical protein